MRSMSILDFPIRKKPRRSSRLELKETRESKQKYFSDSPIGFFGVLPPELIHSVFQWLDGKPTSAITATTTPAGAGPVLRSLVVSWIVKSPRHAPH